MTPSTSSGQGRSLPPQPSIEHLRKQAKDVLKAQRTGDASGAGPLKRLSRFAGASDAAVLGSAVTLHEAQVSVAMQYGFANWQELRDHVRGRRSNAEASLEAVQLRCEHEIPEYAGAGVALGVTAALNHAGETLDFMDFAAATGWAFSFGYKYDDISSAFMAVAGNPRGDGPYEVFAWLPKRLGFGYKMAPTKEPGKLWPFVVKHIDAGTPIMSEHIDGGLISGFREEGGKRQVYFDGTVGAGWTNLGDLHPYGVYVLVRQSDPLPPDQIARESLKRALKKGRSRSAGGVAQGMSALRAYLADVADASKDFDNCGEWFCWAAFERLLARRCCQIWLDRVAGRMPEQAASHVRQAARSYGEAYEHYEALRSAVSAGEPTEVSLRQRARTGERIRAIVPLLEKGIAAEKQGLSALAKAAKSIS